MLSHLKKKQNCSHFVRKYFLDFFGGEQELGILVVGVHMVIFGLLCFSLFGNEVS